MTKAEADVMYIIAKLRCATDREIGLVAAFVSGLGIVGMDTNRCAEILQGRQ